MNLTQQWTDSAAPILGDTIINVLIWGSIFTLLGLIVAIVVLGYIKRSKLLQRKPLVWNILAKFSYLFILVAFLLSGFFSGAIYGTQKTLHQVLIETLKPSLEAQMPALRQKLGEQLAPVAGNTVLTVRELLKPTLQELVYTPKSDGFVESVKSKIINEVLYKTAAFALTTAFQQSIKGMATLLHVTATENKAGYDIVEFSVQALKNFLLDSGEHVDFSSLDKTIPEVFSSAMERQFASIFNSLYIGLVIKLLLVGLIIGAEMLLYFKYYVPRKQSGELFGNEQQA